MIIGTYPSYCGDKVVWLAQAPRKRGDKVVWLAQAPRKRGDKANSTHSGQHSSARAW